MSAYTPFTVTGCTAPDHVGVTAAGELDLATAPSFAAKVDLVCLVAGAAGCAGDLLLDLAGVTFLDSAALSAVSRARTSATDRGWRVRVTPPQACGPRRLMQLAARAGLSVR